MTVILFAPLCNVKLHYFVKFLFIAQKIELVISISVATFINGAWRIFICSHPESPNQGTLYRIPHFDFIIWMHLIEENMFLFVWAQKICIFVVESNDFLPFSRQFMPQLIRERRRGKKLFEQYARKCLLAFFHMLNSHLPLCEDHFYFSVFSGFLFRLNLEHGIAWVDIKKSHLARLAIKEPLD